MNDIENDCYFLTKAEYEEFGADYMKEHRCSNYKINLRESNHHRHLENKSNEYNNNDYHEPNKKLKLN